MKKSEKLKTYTLDELTAKFIGKKDTLKRKQFESKLSKHLKKIINEDNDLLKKLAK